MNEDVVLAVVAVVAGVCLLAGLVQALRVPPRRRPRRARVGVSRVPARGRQGEPVARSLSRPETAERVPAVEAPTVDATPPSPRRSPFAFSPRARPAPPDVPSPSPPVPPVEPELSAARVAAPAPTPEVAVPSAPSEEPLNVQEAAGERVAPAQTSPGAGGATLPVGDCLALFEGEQYQEVIRTAESALEGALGEVSGASPSADETAALWSLLARSRQALGDEEGARSALEEAIHAAPEADRPAYQRQMAALARNVSRQLLAGAEQIAEDSGEERVDRLRQAMLWIRQGLAEMPGDEELSSAQERVRRGLRASYNQAVTALIQRQEFHRSRRLIREALADEEVPADRREHFKELLAATFTEEIGHLTASAIRTLEEGREQEALTFLQQAEGILGAMPADAMTPKRREDVTRRLWWGYTKLGVQRVGTGQYEDALEPLFHALEIGEIDPARQRETRSALKRALEWVVATRATTISELAKDGKRGAAIEEAERLKSLIQQSLGSGLSQQELSPAISRASRIIESLGPGAD